MTDFLEEQLSDFLCNWRLEIERTFVGRNLLLDNFFGKLGSSIFALLTNFFDSCDPNRLRNETFLSELPLSFLILGEDSSGKRYFLNELFSSYLKVTSYYWDLRFELVKCISLEKSLSLNEKQTELSCGGLIDLKRRLEEITMQGRLLSEHLVNKNREFLFILVYFESTDLLLFKECLYSISSYSVFGINYSYLVANLINNYLELWRREKIPILSFFINTFEKDYTQNLNSLDLIRIKKISELFKPSYGLVFEFDFTFDKFVKTNQLQLFKYIVKKKYILSDETLHHLIDFIPNYNIEFIETLTNKEIFSLINDIDLIRIKSIIDVQKKNESLIVVCSGKFITIQCVKNGLNPNFYDIFLSYLEFAIKTFDSKDNRKVNCRFSLITNNMNSSNGLKGIIGCETIISEITNYIFPHILPSSNLSNCLIKNEDILGIAVIGDKGCGKSFLVRSIAEEIKYDMLTIYSADIYNATIGHLERLILDLIEFSVTKRNLVILFEGIDQYFGERNNVFSSLLFFLDVVSRSNKWIGTRILVFSTFSSVEKNVYIDIFQVSLN